MFKNFQTMSIMFIVSRSRKCFFPLILSKIHYIWKLLINDIDKSLPTWVIIAVQTISFDTPLCIVLFLVDTYELCCTTTRMNCGKCTLSLVCRYLQCIWLYSWKSTMTWTRVYKRTHSVRVEFNLKF
jgi:hypothetical protein